jgi:hypothetical protein
MRWSWLSSPLVGLLTFLAALIAVGQWLVSCARALRRAIRRITASPYPLTIQLAMSLDGFGWWLSSRLVPDPDKRPRLFVVGTVPLTTWLRRPAAGLDSYRRHIQVWREFEMAGLERVDPIDTLREWSVRYGMVNPDDLDLVRGGRQAVT